MRDAFIHLKITANRLCIVGVSMEHIRLLLLLLQSIINKPLVNYKWSKVTIHWKATSTQRIFTNFREFF